MGITENAAYLKGLFDGYELDATSKEVKLIGAMLNLMEKMAEQINALAAENEELREYIEEIDEDLGAVEEDLYFTDEEDEDDYSDLNDDEDYEKVLTIKYIDKNYQDVYAIYTLEIVKEYIENE